MRYLILTFTICAALTSGAQQTITVRDNQAERAYLEVDEQPEYPYGVDPREWIKQQRYECEEEGTVIVEFVVDQNGNISNARISNSLSTNCDARALEIINSMGQWKPGILKGNAVPTRIFLPIPFVQNGPQSR